MMTTFKPKTNEMVYVCNAHNTTDDPRQYGFNSWREYWEAHGQNRFALPNKKRIIWSRSQMQGVRDEFQCLACGEYFLWDGTAPDCFDGCHVCIVGDLTQRQYIFPFCHTCNHEDIMVNVPRNMLVPAP